MTWKLRKIQGLLEYDYAHVFVVSWQLLCSSGRAEILVEPISQCCSAHKKLQLPSYYLILSLPSKTFSISIWPFIEKLASFFLRWLFYASFQTSNLQYLSYPHI